MSLSNSSRTSTVSFFLRNRDNITPIVNALGEYHDQGDAKWMLFREQSRGQNDTPLGRPTPGRPIAYWSPSGRIWWFRLLLISNNIV
jgi:hypothetical protein